MIECIFIQSHKLEVSNRLPLFLLELSKHVISIPVYLFLNKSSLDNDLGYLNNYKDLITDIIYIDDDVRCNKISYMFYKIINSYLEYQYVLLLETDCILNNNFINLIDNDIEDRKFLLYGSRYYGICNWSNYSTLTIDKCTKNGLWLLNASRNHINGVCIYNRSKLLMNIIDYIFIKLLLINSGSNYDYLLSFYILNKYGNVDYLIDSKYILNISDNSDKYLNYSDIKPDAVIIHKKST